MRTVDAVLATAMVLLVPFDAPFASLAVRPRPAHATAPDTLRQPPTLRNRSTVPGLVDVDLTAAQARLQLIPGGPPVDVYAYNGMVPGPTLDVREGDSVVVHFHNQLPEATTVHWHGLHLPANDDGSPLFPVAPGSTYVYTFRIPRGWAGTYWYHPHPDARSSYQVAMGLFGALIVHAPDDPLARLALPDKILILSDNRFDAHGAISFPDSGSIQAEVDLENGREGNVLMVNGQVMPTIPIRPGGVQRWRIVNASASRVYRLSLPGQQLIHVGSDGGLFAHPVAVHDIVVANSGRVEVLVQGGSTPGQRVAFQDLPYDRYMPQTRPADWDSVRALLSLVVSHAPAARPVRIPTLLRYVPPLDTTHVAVHRVLVMSQGMIDGRKMTSNHVDLHGHLGTTEIWEIQNVVGMDHPFHLHGFRFQVLDRDDVPEAFPSWKDLVNVPKHSSVRIVVHFDDFPGTWMYHCHILDHEDEGMMGALELN
jgi:FtsP/CotA-like multicopper oxidase with cupredoxin domain